MIKTPFILFTIQVLCVCSTEHLIIHLPLMVEGKKQIYTSRILCHCSLDWHMKQCEKADVGLFGVCLLLRQRCSLSVLWMVTSDRLSSLDIPSEVADQRGLLCFVCFQTVHSYLYTAKLSVCMNVCVHALQVCMDVCACERVRERRCVFSLCVAGTDCLHLCKYTLTCACNSQ